MSKELNIFTMRESSSGRELEDVKEVGCSEVDGLDVAAENDKLDVTGRERGGKVLAEGGTF